MSNLKKFELYVECTGINGHQVFACEAENEQAAKQMFRDGQCTIIDEQLEVTDLERSPFSIEESDDISSRLHSDTEQALNSECLHHKKMRLKQASQIRQIEGDKDRLRMALKNLIEASESNEAQLSAQLLEIHAESAALRTAKRLLIEFERG